MHQRHFIQLQSILEGYLNALLCVTVDFNVIALILRHIWNTVIHTSGCHKKRPVKGSETTTLKRFLINTSVTQALFWSFVLFTSFLPFHQTHTQTNTCYILSLFWSTSSTPLCWQISGYTMLSAIKASTSAHYKLRWTKGNVHCPRQIFFCFGPVCIQQLNFCTPVMLAQFSCAPIGERMLPTKYNQTVLFCSLWTQVKKTEKQYSS